MTASHGAKPTEETLFGHPKGLTYLACTELWERFSYYGMAALVVLYMINHLYLPGNIDRVVGMATYRALLESGLGPLSIQALAYQTYGLYAGLIYFTPIVGGMLADRVLGTKVTVLLGAILMSAGHFAMVFDEAFLLALLLLICGAGLLKGNISAQIGQLYPPGDDSRRARGFTVFTMAINLGAVSGTLVCALLAQLYGWHVGFGVAGALMLLATCVYVAGQRFLPSGRPERRQRSTNDRLTAEEWRSVLLMLLVITLTIPMFVGQSQIFTTGVVWLSSHGDLRTSLGDIPPPWFLAWGAFMGIVAVPPLVSFWARMGQAGTEPSPVTKIGIGALILSLSAVILAIGSAAAGTGKVSIIYPLVSYAINGVAFMFYWPVTLALVSQIAPAKVNATLVGAAFLAIFVGNTVGGWFSHFYERMSPGVFWMADAGLTAAAALVVLMIQKPLTRAIQRRHGPAVA